MCPKSLCSSWQASLLDYPRFCSHLTWSYLVQETASLECAVEIFNSTQPQIYMNQNRKQIQNKTICWWDEQACPDSSALYLISPSLSSELWGYRRNCWPAKEWEGESFVGSNFRTWDEFDIWVGVWHVPLRTGNHCDKLLIPQVLHVVQSLVLLTPLKTLFELIDLGRVKIGVCATALRSEDSSVRRSRM